MYERPFSTDHLDYLTRSNCLPGPLPNDTPLTIAPPNLRRLWRIQGVGYPDKISRPVWQPPEAPRFDLGESSSAQVPMRMGSETRTGRLNSEDILIGMYGYKIPLAFLVWGLPGDLSVNLGVWSQAGRENAPANVLESRMNILAAVLKSLYPSIELVPATQTEINRPPAAGLALGIPTA
jgi:hypothetical protein